MGLSGLGTLPSRGAFIASVVLLSCGTSCKEVVKAISERVGGATSKQEAKKKVPTRPATQAEAEQFAGRLTAAARSGHGLGKVMDSEAIIDRAMGDIQYPAEAASSWGQQLTERISRDLQQTLAKGGTYKLGANRTIDGERRVKFRLLHGDGSFNYHDFVVVWQAGEVKAVDLHVLVTGEPLSATLRRVLLPIAAEANKNIVDRLTKAESIYVKNADKIGKMSEPHKNPKGVLAVYEELPEELKSNKSIQAIRLQAASASDDDATYMAVIEDYRRRFPADPSVQIVSVDYFFMKKMYREALQGIDVLERMAGPDAYLNVLRASTHLELQDLDAARRETAAALKREPDLAPAVNLGIALDLAEGNEKAALQKINEARRLKVDLSDVEQNPDYIALMARQKQAPAP